MVLQISSTNKYPKMTSPQLPPSSSFHVEPLIKESNYIRDMVFGFGDGVNTSRGIAGVGGADAAANIIILAALVKE